MINKIIKIKFLACFFVFLVFLFFDPVVSARTNSEFVEYAIKAQTENILSQIEVYVRLNHDKSASDIFKDKIFRDIVFQPVGDTGYGAIADPDTGILLVHPVESIVGIELSVLGEKAPDWWVLVEKSFEKEICGHYNWPEPGGGYSDKYLCSKFFNINNKQYSLAVTAYVGEFENIIRSEETPHIFAVESIKNKAREVARQIEIFLTLNPGKSIVDFRQDEYFNTVAVQSVGKTGYTLVGDCNELIVLFHKDPDFVGFDMHKFSEINPALWQVARRVKGGHESGGFHPFEETDGSIRDKYSYMAIVDIDNNDECIFVAATTYLDEYDDMDRVMPEKEKEEKAFFKSAKLAIRQKAEDVAKQIEIYLRAYSDKTVADLQNDPAFQEIAVQPVGATGYTAVTDGNSGEFYFTPQESMVGKNIDMIKDIVPEVWHKFNEIRGNCKDDGMFYNWPEEDGTISEKYTYLSCINALTADGKSLVVDASTYLEEFSGIEEAATNNDESLLAVEQKDISYTVVAYWLIGILFSIFLTIYILHRFKVIKFERTLVFYLLGGTILIIVWLFVFSVFQITRAIEKQKLGSVVNHLSSAATSRSRFIDYFIDEQIDKTKIAATHHDLSDEELKLISNSSREVYEVFVLDSKGVIINSSDTASIGLNRSQDSYFTGVKGKPFIKPVYYSETKNRPSVAISVPFKEGVLVTKLSLETLGEIMADPTGFGETGESFLAYRNKNGDAEFISPLRFKEKSPGIILKERINVPITQALLKNDKVFLNSIDYRDIPVISATRYIKDLDVGLVAKIDKQEALAPAKRMINNIWLSTLGAIAIIIIIGIIFNYLLTLSLKKEVRSKTEEINKNSKFIKEQLKKEEEATRVQERLVKEQKQAKAALEEKVEELEKFQKLTVNREIRMIELKKKIKDLEEKLL